MDRNKYKKWYDRLIAKARGRSAPSGYTERHHVLPKSLGGKDNFTNVVILTAREHYIAHLLLVKMYEGKAKSKMVRALVRFALKAGRSFELARTIISKESLGARNPSHGKKWSYDPDTLEISYSVKIPDSNVIGLPFQLGGSKKGCIWINDGYHETLIDPSAIPDGWQLGRITKADAEQLKQAAKARHTADKDQEHRKKLAGRIAISHPDTKEVKRIHTSMVDRYLEDGWTLGGVTTSLSQRCQIQNVVYNSIGAAAKALNLTPMTISYRLRSKTAKWQQWFLIDRQDAATIA